LLDAAQLQRLVVEFAPTYLVHLGARTDVFERRSITGYAANMQGTQNLIDAANACVGLRRIIMTSTRLVCRIGYQPIAADDFCPPNFYGESKAEMERIIRRNHIKAEWLITRPTAIWGPGFLVPSYRDFFEQIRKGRYFHLGAANPRKTFGYIGNTLHQMHSLLTAPSDQVQGHIFYLGDYEPLQLREWADMIAHEFGRKPISTLPLGLLRAGSLAGDMMVRVGWRNFPLTSPRLRNMLADSVHDLTPIATVAGALPHTLEEATRDTVAWLKDNP
jgi:nucleoside-diphosphate-sugar epimerase